MTKMPGNLRDLSQKIYGKGKTEGVGECGLGPGSAVQDEGIPDWIGRINLVGKRAEERSAGNLHAPFEVAGAGNGVARLPRQPSTLPR
jgi:hypothetical protein